MFRINLAGWQGHARKSLAGWQGCAPGGLAGCPGFDRKTGLMVGRAAMRSGNCSQSAQAGDLCRPRSASASEGRATSEDARRAQPPRDDRFGRTRSTGSRPWPGVPPSPLADRLSPFGLRGAWHKRYDAGRRAVKERICMGHAGAAVRSSAGPWRPRLERTSESAEFSPPCGSATRPGGPTAHAVGN